MVLRFRRHADFPVTLIRLSGTLDVSSVRGELSRALPTSDHVARGDRVVVAQEEIERDGVYISDLAEPRQVVAQLEGLRHAETAYRSVIYPRYPVRPATVVEVILRFGTITGNLGRTFRLLTVSTRPKRFWGSRGSPSICRRLTTGSY